MSLEILCQNFGGILFANIRLLAWAAPHEGYSFYKTGMLQVYPVGEFLSN